MSPDGHVRSDGAGAVLVATFPMAPGTRFEWHTHDEHQLAWAPSGVLTVVTDSAAWVLPPTRALWIPAGTRHETAASGPATMRSLYVTPSKFPLRWDRPEAVGATDLLAQLIDYLGRDDLEPSKRGRAEALLADVLEPVPTTTIDVRMPGGGPAADVASGLVADPADRRSIDEWGRQVGASGRTLARAFVAETGIGFARWRTLVRLRAALPALAKGEAVATVSRRVGYETPSAFVAAFRRETGVTPHRYFGAG